MKNQLRLLWLFHVRNSHKESTAWRRRLPPLNPLRAFEATARHGSVSAAARELNVTHGAVSHQIRALEDNLGIGLFERGGQRRQADGAGRAAAAGRLGGLREHRCGDRADDAAGDAPATCRSPACRRCFPSGCCRGITSFTEQFPDIRLTLVPSNDPSRIHAPEIDVCILYGDGNWPDCWLKHWTDLELFPVISPTLLNNRPIRTVRDLRDHVILHADDGREWHAWLAAADALDLVRGAPSFHERCAHRHRGGDVTATAWRSAIP